MTPHVFVLGAGRAGRSLAVALEHGGVEITGLHGRRADDGPPKVSAGALPASIARANTLLLTVRDVQLDGAIHELLDAPLMPGAVILHASGATDPSGLAALRKRGHPCGTLHPLVPLASPERAVEVLRNAWIGIDGDPAAVHTAEVLTRALGARALTIPEGQKARYHAAAVFAANFPVVLSSVAGELLRTSGVPEHEARFAVHALMAAAVENVRDGEPVDVLTGPIARGDVDSVRRHLVALSGDPAVRAMYVVLARAALPLAQAQGTPPERLDAIASLLTGAD